VIIEIMEVDKLAIHHDVARVVDKMLRGQQPRPEIRVRNVGGQVEVVQRAEVPADRPGERTGGTYGVTYSPDGSTVIRGEREYGSSGRSGGDSRDARSGANGLAEPPGKRNLPAVVRMFPYGVSRSRLERAIANLRVPATVSRDVNDADIVIALKATFRREPAKLQEARGRTMGVYVVKSNTYIQIENVVREVFGMEGGALPTDEEAAIQEAEEAIEQVRETVEAIELAPQNSFIRRIQHQLVERSNLVSESVGVEPKRRIRVSAK